MTRFFFVAASIALIPLATPTFAQDALTLELQAMAKEHIVPLVEKRGGGSIAIGGFSAASSIKGGSGPEIQLKLTEILQKLNAKVATEDYRFEITGNYLAYNDPDSKLTGVKVIGRLVDAEDGTTLGEFPRFVFGPRSVPKLLGLSVNTRGKQSPKILSASFKKAIEKPQVFRLGSQITTSPASPYAIELLAKSGSQYIPRQARLDSKSRLFAGFEQNEVYAIRLINHSKHEAAVSLTIDGVNVFAFSKQSPRPSHWIVPPKKDGKPGVTLVRGWDQTTGTSLEFKVTDFPNSAAAKVHFRPSSNIGTITAAFSACWSSERDRPRDEGRTRATGFGDQIVDKKTLLKRHIGHIRDTISVRYEK